MPKRQSESISLPRDLRLGDSRQQGTSMSLPLAVHYRLDQLAEAAADVKASRAEIVAMLIAAADLDPAQLERSVLAYRKLTVGDVVREPAADAQAEADAVASAEASASGEVVVPLRGPGRPKRSTGT